MELQLIKIMLYGFSFAIILLFIYITTLVAFFIKHVAKSNNRKTL